MQKAVELQSRGLTLRGMLHVPENHEGKVPVVLIFHGFTGNKMEPHFIFVKLSRLLESKGIASVRFDFGGSGESDGDFVDMTLSGELQDAINILDYAKTLDFVDTSRIGVVGLSMGGAVGGMLAGERKEDIRALCLWAPAGNMKEAILSRYSDENLSALNKSGYIDLGGLLLGKGFVEDIMKVDIIGKTAQYDKNVLILHGDNDTAVPVETSDRYLEVFEKRCLLHIIEGADHTFNRKNWEDEVLEHTAAFLQEEFKML
ncbi:alpha/beta hydrolase [Clostridium thermosuccinogenes]|jgi:dienelactone hydrolase|uniref:Alpha/beta hydrolase n=1 Tax=Clostridium thermosuccinogenes TaxID=84032 RepID=A0A2K2FFG7_9CLOT|nr:alpha/beta hydrolase [Pseudoclostridium thermosuccinogenes]AUS96698.1 alpha/beta hydrolase [Pseudoclostridium thermosuccinogenes]PNT96316.1 alpha/beta hydrolase [Pseudoclostridium thermosuccinogenes]PNT97525.1 alpha/beta hydrolase [Pseudoclostridium thermosuccinogenes]